MTNHIRYVISNTVNYVSPEIQVDDSANTFPHIFGNKEFSFEVSFFANNNTTPIGDIEIANVSIDSAPNYVTVIPIDGNTMRITKVANTSLFEEGYTFSDINANTLIQTIESIDISEVLSYNRTNKTMIAWDTPPEETANSNAEEIGQFLFTINDGINSNNTVSYAQSYFWSPDDGFQYFQDILEEL